MYTWARMRSHVTFFVINDKGEEIGGLELETQAGPVKMARSWKRSLLSRPAQQNLPRKSTIKKFQQMASQFTLVMIGLTAAGIYFDVETRPRG
jgi:hypothetical protein